VGQEKSEKLRSKAPRKLLLFFEQERNQMKLSNDSRFNKRFSWDCACDPKTGIVYYFSVKTGEILFTEKGGIK